MRSILAIGSATWFLGAALLIGDGAAGLMGEPPNQTIIGEPAAMAIHFVGRILFVGLGLLALALVDWRAVVDFFR
jgi:hypothetical protein